MLLDNCIGLDTERTLKVYLPPGYGSSKKSYPVVYYFHNIFWNPEKMFADGIVTKRLEEGFANGTTAPFIFVAADFSTATTGCVYENSPVSGRWLDFIVQELVPYIDKRFRTLPHRDSRAAIGDFMGGRGALKLAMTYPDVFSIVYALHPVATGAGRMPWRSLPIDWKKTYNAQSAADVGTDGRTQLFVTISQAFLPNPARPPFYCDFFMEPQNGKPTLHPVNLRRTQTSFHLEEMLDSAAANLRTLRALAFDWGRFDSNQDHVYANQTFSKKLEDLGIEHEAEEYRGDPWNRVWIEHGRFSTRVLPFLSRHLRFEPGN